MLLCISGADKTIIPLNSTSELLPLCIDLLSALRETKAMRSGLALMLLRVLKLAHMQQHAHMQSLAYLFPPQTQEGRAGEAHVSLAREQKGADGAAGGTHEAAQGKA